MDLFWQINWEEMFSDLIVTTFIILLPASVVVVSSMVMFPLIDVAFKKKAKPAPKDTRERRTIDYRQPMPYSIIQPTGMRGEVTELDLMKAERDDKAFADNWRDAEIKKLYADHSRPAQVVEPWHAQLSGLPWLALRHAKCLRPDAAPHSQLMSYPTAQERAPLDPLVGMAHHALAHPSLECITPLIAR